MGTSMSVIIGALFCPWLCKFSRVQILYASTHLRTHTNGVSQVARSVDGDDPPRPIASLLPINRSAYVRMAFLTNYNNERAARSAHAAVARSWQQHGRMRLDERHALRTHSSTQQLGLVS